MLKNGITESFLISIVNLILLWKLFNVVNMRLLSPFLQNKWYILSTYLFHILVLFSKGELRAMRSVCT